MHHDSQGVHVFDELPSILQQASPQYEYFAVFDGHGGRDAANYCAAHLHLVLAEQLRAGLDVPAAIEKAFKIVDGNFCDR